MARVSKCTLGEIRGRVGEVVFYVYRGKQKVKAYIRRKEADLFKKVKSGNLSCAEKRKLTREIIFGVFGYLFECLRPLIWRYWARIVRSKGLRITPSNMFVRYNFNAVLRSIPNKYELISHKNKPDLSKIWLVYGWLSQPPQEPRFVYRAGKVRVSWDPTIWRDERADDRVCIVVVYLPISDIRRTPKIWESMKVWTVPDISTLSSQIKSASSMCCKSKLLHSKMHSKMSQIESAPTRADKEYEFEIDKGLDVEWLYVWVFFANSHTCSQSYSCVRDVVWAF